ncbi:ASCH domain-containing protein [Bacillus sp. FJAT-26390]|uniref:ASCH domain-containing protein n=1 Tax=Bacillus sp. FJAT-26390 TaxID=1743142 RepID=UPI000807E817|nr:ASCH domain-containing protein [Bacillus sp. FJAT-26390]OBZ15145.1 2-oxoglutarate dehydrogenase E1 [Bacillus sp. FJAT-26390]
MKVITIIQPWATLIAIGEKHFETRSWPTKHRGPIAIHAGKKIDREACEQKEIKATLEAHGYTIDNLPTGAIVATGTISECYKTRQYGMSDFVELTSDSGIKSIDGPEFVFGDYSTGRFAWEITGVDQLREPIPAKGQQGLWNWAAGDTSQ